MEVIPLAVIGLCVQGLKNIWTTNTVLQEHLLQGRAALFDPVWSQHQRSPAAAESTKIQLRTHAIILSISPVIPSNNHHPVASAVKAASTTGMWNLARCTHHTSVSGYFRSFYTGNRPVWLNVTATAYNVHKTNPAGRRWGVQSGYMLLICSVCV